MTRKILGFPAFWPKGRVEDFLKAALFILLAWAGTARADQIKALTRGDHSLAAFYQTIASAQKSIDLTTYEFEPCDAVTKVLLDAVAQKARSGVKVRIIAEAYYLKDPKRGQLAAWLEAKGKPPGAKEGNIEFRKYGTSALIAGDASRNHSKYLVVDGGDGGATMVTGGRNLTDEYFGLSSKLNYLDQDLLIRGSSASDGWKFFNELWAHSSKVPPQGSAEAFERQCMAMGPTAKAVLSWVQKQSGQVLSSRRPHSCDVDYAVDHPRFLDRGCFSNGDDGFLGNGECYMRKRATRQVLDFFKGTQSKLQIVNQYYYPWEKARETIDYLRERKKRTIEVYSNATAGLDDMPMHDTAFTCYIQSSGYQSFKGTQKVKLLTSKGALRDSWSLTPAGARRWRIHTKSAIRDEKDVLVSSWNIDPRSYQTNLETAAVVRNCPGLVKDIEEQYEQLKITHKADENCAACKSDFVRANMSDTVWCGGTPTFY